MKIDVLIKGNIICDAIIRGGYIISDKSEENYDCSNCSIFIGDLHVHGSVDFKDKHVLVLGNIVGGF